MRSLPVLLLLFVAGPAAADDFKIQPGAFGGPRKLGAFKPNDAAAEEPGAAGGSKGRVKLFDPRKMQPDAPVMPTLSSGPIQERRVSTFEPPPPEQENVPEIIPEEAPDPVKAEAAATAYIKEVTKPVEEQPVRWRLWVLGLVGTLLTVPVLRVAWRRFSHEHQMEGAVGSVPADIMEQRRDLGSAERLIPVSDKALNVVRRAGGWVPASRVASQIGVEPDEAEQLLTILEEEGRLQRQLDDEGRALFRFVSRAS